MNIFISYGHGKYDFLVKRLADDLRKCEYNVFLDMDYLNGGDDWMTKIDEHIRSAHYFLFLSSAKSVSGEGYCLNEICRAERYKVKIIPIMLDESVLPLSIEKIQYFSLVDCVDPDNEIVELKYKFVLRQLLGILNGSTKMGYSDEDKRLVSALNPISSREFMFLHYNYFCGRKEAFERFEKFVSSNRNLMWIKANPGTGKTAFSSMLVWRYPQYVKAVHFCKFNNSDRANPKNIITSIVYQLTSVLPEYKKKICERGDLNTIFDKSASRILEVLLLDPLQDIKADEPVVVVIDALDEISWRGENEICNILQAARERFPQWLKFVLTSRDEANIRSILSTIAMTYTLSDEENDDDIRAYYKKEFPNAPEEKIEALLAKTDGSFLYANEIVKQIREENLSLDDINIFPVGIYGFFNDWFGRLFKKEVETKYSFKDVTPILEFICISREPADLTFMKNYLQIEPYAFRDMLNLIGGLFPKNENNQIEPIHKSLIDWLVDEDLGHAYFVSKEIAYQRLLAYIEERYAQKDYDDAYLIKNFANTLVALKKYDRLAEILDDYELQSAIIDKLEFDFGLERYLSELEYLYVNKREACIKLFSGNAFKEIFSRNRRLLYNSGMFIRLKNIGLTSVLRQDQESWSTEGEIGKAFYYYIVEEFDRAIKKVEELLETEAVKSDAILQSELYNVKGLSERKLVRFDEAIESFGKCIAATEASVGKNRDNSDVDFELSLANLIISKINMHMLNFAKSNETCRDAIKILESEIRDMPDGDKKTSNMLFLAEEYRVFANACIWQEYFDNAIDYLLVCEGIYKQYNNSTDRYFVRFRYTSILYKIMKKEWNGVLEQLRELLDKEAKSEYDKGAINYYIALYVYLSGTEDTELLQMGFDAAKKGVKIYDAIDSLLERAECNYLAGKLSCLMNTRYMSVDDNNDYIKAWIGYIDEMLERMRNV